MSLDVYLQVPGAQHRTDNQIYIREGGSTKAITRAEWDARFPDQEPAMVYTSEEDDTVFSANITHNLNQMAEHAGIYQYLWRPDEIGITTAVQLIEPLRAGLARLRAEPATYQQYNPSNGWGSYDGLVAFVAEYLAACEQWPDALVSVWR